MRPVIQTDDECFAAAVASIFHLDLDQVPNLGAADFEKKIAPEVFWDTWRGWCDQFGLRLVTHKIDGCESCKNGVTPKGYTVLHVEAYPGAPDDYHHALVAFNGDIVHDPRRGPLAAPFGALKYWYWFEVADPAKFARLVPMMKDVQQ